MKLAIRLSEQIYDFFLRLYPFSYRKEFGGEMKYVYSQSIKDAYSENGEIGIVKFWVISLIDGIKSLFSEHLENGKGGGSMKAKSTDILMQNKIFVYIAMVTGLILTFPLIAMQFSNEVDWQLFDFIVMGILIMGTGSLFVFVARAMPRKYRVVVGLGFLLALLLTWVHLAVGIVDTWPLAGS